MSLLVDDRGRVEGVTRRLLLLVRQFDVDLWRLEVDGVLVGFLF